MYTAADVMNIMDALPLEERLLVLEATLRKIRVTESSSIAVPTSTVARPTGFTNLNWIDKIAGKWADLDDTVFAQMTCANDQIDEDEIENLSF